MRAKDLQLLDLLKFQPDSGIIRLLDQRVLIMDSLALGLLHKELVDAIGINAARAILSRFGYAHGWRTAESLKRNLPELIHSDSDTGPHLHTMQGVFTHLELERTTDSKGNPIIYSSWKDSYEVEQYKLHYGDSEDPICWTTTAFASGYVSNRMRREVLFIEKQCCAQGADTCKVEGRLREHWGDEYDDQLCYYNPGTIDTLLPEVNQKLKKLEQKLELKKQQIAELNNSKPYNRLCAKSSAMREVIDLAQRISQVDASVVISGESGVGKEKIARLIHDQSPRANHPFVAINCGALTESLLESELFGYVKGAFTDAAATRTGLFEAAEGGTLFLDEIGEISPAMQVKILRTIQEREVRRIGENISRPIDIRIISATNRKLIDEISTGRFRKDLYYRLRVIELTVPPLRERTEDIIPLARYFLDSAASRTERKRLALSSKAAKLLLLYNWPGNVRELENVVEYAVALTTGNEIESTDLPEELSSVPLPGDQSIVRTLKQIEQDYIQSVLDLVDGNKSKAAEALGIGIATLYRKLKQ